VNAIAEFFNLGELSRLELTFAICAVVGGTLFVMRMVLFALGMGGDDLDADADLEGDSGFSGLSIHGLTAFFMMFGLVGLALLRGSGQPPSVAIMGAVLAGGGSLLLSSQIFRAFRRLQETGTIDYSAAVGEEGSVYLTISKGGVGQVQITFAGRSRVMDARSENGEEIPTDHRVRVRRLIEGNVLVVEEI